MDRGLVKLAPVMCARWLSTYRTSAGNQEGGGRVAHRHHLLRQAVFCSQGDLCRRFSESRDNPHHPSSPSRPHTNLHTGIAISTNPPSYPTRRLTHQRPNARTDHPICHIDPIIPIATYRTGPDRSTPDTRRHTKGPEMQLYKGVGVRSSSCM